MLAIKWKTAVMRIRMVYLRTNDELLYTTPDFDRIECLSRSPENEVLILIFCTRFSDSPRCHHVSDFHTVSGTLSLSNLDMIA